MGTGTLASELGSAGERNQDVAMSGTLELGTLQYGLWERYRFLEFTWRGQLRLAAFLDHPSGPELMAVLKTGVWPH